MVGADRPFAGLSTDTRTLKAGELFVALDGPNFAGRDFVPAAGEKRAAGAIVAGAATHDLAQIDFALLSTKCGWLYVRCMKHSVFDFLAVAF